MAMERVRPAPCPCGRLSPPALSRPACGRIVEVMATRSLHLDPALQEAVERAREAIAEAGGLGVSSAERYESPLGDQEREAVARILRDGTYRRLADAVAADDAELADL